MGEPAGQLRTSIAYLEPTRLSGSVAKHPGRAPSSCQAERERSSALSPFRLSAEEENHLQGQTGGRARCCTSAVP